MSHYVFQESHMRSYNLLWIASFINVNFPHNSGTLTTASTTPSGALVREGQALTGETYGV